MIYIVLFLWIILILCEFFQHSSIPVFNIILVKMINYYLCYTVYSYAYYNIQQWLFGLENRWKLYNVYCKVKWIFHLCNFQIRHKKRLSFNSVMLVIILSRILQTNRPLPITYPILYRCLGNYQNHRLPAWVWKI